MEKNLTTGSVFKTILYFALPYLFSYFLQTLYGMADLFIIGQFNGTESTTAVANAGGVRRQSGHAHADRHDRRSGNGIHCHNRACRRCQA